MLPVSIESLIGQLWTKLVEDFTMAQIGPCPLKINHYNDTSIIPNLSLEMFSVCLLLNNKLNYISRLCRKILTPANFREARA